MRSMAALEVAKAMSLAGDSGEFSERGPCISLFLPSLTNLPLFRADPNNGLC